MKKHLIDFSERVTEEEAIEKMLHHLKLAASYFEVTPEEFPSDRLFALDDYTRLPAQAFIAALEKYYADLGATEMET